MGEAAIGEAVIGDGVEHGAAVPDKPRIRADVDPEGGEGDKHLRAALDIFRAVTGKACIIVLTGCKQRDRTVRGCGDIGAERVGNRRRVGVDGACVGVCGSET